MKKSSDVEVAIRKRCDKSQKALVAYVTGGLGDDWVKTVEAVVAAGADVVEVGIPFSDPVMDGPTIQEANDLSLSAGATPMSILEDLRQVDISVPLVVMTYFNIAFRAGLKRFASLLAESGVVGCILPDLPLEEIDPWVEAAEGAAVDTILLVAPTAPEERLPLICNRSRGFVYAVGLLGVTGVRSELAASAIEISKRVKKVSSLPVLVGVGIGTPKQAVEAAEYCDGVVIGSAVVNSMIEDRDPDSVGEVVREFRSALDANYE